MKQLTKYANRFGKLNIMYQVTTDGPSLTQH